jgi:TrmH family RNA methyltransferase
LVEGHELRRQGLIALVEPPVWQIERLFQASGVLVVLDGIQDPGNAGTIVRTAEAFGASGVVFLKGSVSPFNAKTLRASAGSLFRVPFVSALEPAIARCVKRLNVFLTRSSASSYSKAIGRANSV